MASLLSLRALIDQYCASDSPERSQNLLRSNAHMINLEAAQETLWTLAADYRARLIRKTARAVSTYTSQATSNKSAFQNLCISGRFLEVLGISLYYLGDAAFQDALISDPDTLQLFSKAVEDLRVTELWLGQSAIFIRDQAAIDGLRDTMCVLCFVIDLVDINRGALLNAYQIKRLFERMLHQIISCPDGGDLHDSVRRAAFLNILRSHSQVNSSSNSRLRLSVQESMRSRGWNEASCRQILGLLRRDLRPDEGTVEPPKLSLIDIFLDAMDPLPFRNSDGHIELLRYFWERHGAGISLANGNEIHTIPSLVGRIIGNHRASVGVLMDLLLGHDFFYAMGISIEHAHTREDERCAPEQVIKSVKHIYIGWEDPKAIQAFRIWWSVRGMLYALDRCPPKRTVPLQQKCSSSGMSRRELWDVLGEYFWGRDPAIRASEFLDVDGCGWMRCPLWGQSGPSLLLCSFQCSLCKLSYCSLKCQEMDWDSTVGRHREACHARSTVACRP